MIKLVAMDIDGTLLDSNKNLSEENKKTVKEYEERGIKFTFSTGRIDNELEEVSSKMPYVKYGIMCNGAYVIDFENNKMLYSDLLDMSDVRYIYDTVKAIDMDMMFELQADGVIYSERRCIEDTKRYNVYHIDELIKKTRVPVENIGEYIASRDKPVAKVNIFFPTAEIRDEVVDICLLRKKKLKKPQKKELKLIVVGDQRKSLSKTEKLTALFLRNAFLLWTMMEDLTQHMMKMKQLHCLAST